MVVAVALGGVAVGFFGARVLPGQGNPQVINRYILKESGEKVVPEAKLPISSDLLLNPLFYEWTANIEGALVEKTSNSITLEKDGQRFSIDIADTTRFFDQRNVSGSDAGKIVSLKDIPIGANLRGGVFIFDQRKLAPGAEPVVAVGFTLY